MIISFLRGKDKKYQHILKIIVKKKKKEKGKQNPQMHKTFKTSRFKVSRRHLK